MDIHFRRLLSAKDTHALLRVRGMDESLRLQLCVGLGCKSCLHGKSKAHKAVTRRTKVAPTKRMSRFLKHFTVVGDDYHTWNVNYKKWENEEEEEEPAPTSAEGEGNAEGPDAEAGSASTPRQSLDFRSRLRKLFSSHRFQVIIICLVVLDALLVLAELLLDLKIIEPDEQDYAVTAFHYMSFAILVFFMLEIFFKIFVFRLEFFHHKFEILDAFVVVVSFVLDLVLLFKSHHFEALGLLILLRLWRVARIINGIIISVKTRSERQILRLKQINIQRASLWCKVQSPSLPWLAPRDAGDTSSLVLLSPWRPRPTLAAKGSSHQPFLKLDSTVAQK